MWQVCPIGFPLASAFLRSALHRTYVVLRSIMSPDGCLGFVLLALERIGHLRPHA